MSAPSAAEHFASLRVQQHAARLGMWVFLASEVLFFAGFFGLYAAYYTRYTEGFHQAAEENTLWFGTANTFVLLTSSLTAALAVWAIREGRRWLSAGCLLATAVLGSAFLVVKGVEYHDHWKHGLLPGGYFQSEKLVGEGPVIFYTLYWLMTSLHALHMLGGISVMTWLMVRVAKRRLDPRHPVALENGAMYWHLVDVIWLFLWPLLYLVR